jgi:GAF domain-containing protein/HAMP domain-containing protein
MSTDPPSRDTGPLSETPFGQGLSRTLLLWFLLLPIASLLIGGLIITSLALQNTRQAAINRLSSIATLKQSEIEAWVTSQQEQLGLIITTPWVKSKLLYALDAETPNALVIATQDQLQEYFSVLTGPGGTFEELFLLDASGQVLLSSDLSQVGASHAQQAYFMKGQSGPYLHPPNYSLYTAAPSMLVAQPVKDDSGHVWGVLVGRLNWGQIARLMAEDAGLGQTGETYLVNTARLLLTPPHSEQSLRLGQELRTTGVEQGLALSRATSVAQTGWSAYDDPRGRHVLGVYRWVPELQVVLLVEQETSEALALMRGILISGLAILLIVICVAASIALLVSRRITRPLAGLTSTANLIASGDLSHTVPHTERQDEIGTLARAFDQMSEQLRGLIAGLEKQVAERTRQWQEANYNLQRRAIQLEAVTLVGRAVTSILNVDDLLLEVVNLIRARFDFYHAGIFLLDESGKEAVLRQASGEAGQRMLAKQHRLAVGSQSIVGWVTAHRQPRVALDVGADAVHFKNPDLPHTRSEMALPLIVGDRLLGALDVQSIEEAAFDEEDVAILSLMADQVAIAIDNALKFTHESAILEATSPLYRASRHIAVAANLDNVLRSLIDHVACPYIDRCAIQLYGGEAKDGGLAWLEVAALWDRADDPPDPTGTRYPVKPSSLMEHLRREATEPLCVDNLLAEEIDARIEDEAYQLLTKKLGLQAVLIFPLVAAGRTTGLLMVASRQSHTWTEAELRDFRALSAQVASAAENARLLEQARRRAQHERSIRQVTDQMRRAMNVEALLQTAVTRVGQVVGAPRAYIRLGVVADQWPGHTPDEEFPFADELQPGDHATAKESEDR